MVGLLDPVEQLTTFKSNRHFSRSVSN